jgi:hypothetical protein
LNTPQPVVADGVATVEVGDAVGAAVGRRIAVGLALLAPAGTCSGADAQGSELVEGQDPVREVLQHVLDAVELGVALGIGRLFPGLRVLEGDPAAPEQAP